MIVGFEPGFLPNLGVGELLEGLPISMRSDQGNFLTLQVPNLTVVRKIFALMPGVSYVERNGTVQALAVPNDPRYNTQYGPGMMGFPAAWGSIGYGSSSIIVATIDSGILATHQDLVGPRILPGFDYVSNDPTPDDTCGHGTHVAGTIGATANNGLGVAGMSQASILPMKGLAMTRSFFSSGCSGSDAGIANAIYGAVNGGADIISMSIGGGFSTAIQNAVNTAYNAGVILVAAAGNDGSTNGIDYPGAYPNVIAVGALDSTQGAGQLLGSWAAARHHGARLVDHLDLHRQRRHVRQLEWHINGHPARLGCDCARDELHARRYDTEPDHDTRCTPRPKTSALLVSTRPTATVSPGPTSWYRRCAPMRRRRRTRFRRRTSPRHSPVASACPCRRPRVTLMVTRSPTPGTSVTAAPPQPPRRATPTPRAGTYNISLTVSDGRGGSNTLSKTFQATGLVDPDPGTITVINGQVTTLTVNSSNRDQFRKIYVPAGTNTLTVQISGPPCPRTCPVDADLYTQVNVKPTNTKYACRPYRVGRRRSARRPHPDRAGGTSGSSVAPARAASTSSPPSARPLNQGRARRARTTRQRRVALG